jgi:hypothetical protein
LPLKGIWNICYTRVQDRDFSVVDQGVAYLNDKADFILEYNERASSALSSKTLKRDDVD